MSDDLETRAHEASLDGLFDIARAVLEQAERNLPVGDPRVDPDPARSLKTSGKITADGAGFIIEFEGPYAAKQHEDQRLNHPRGGGPKYLERALLEVMPAAEGVVASQVRARMASGLSSDPGRPHRTGQEVRDRQYAMKKAGRA